MLTPEFPHLHLIHIQQGRAKLEGGGRKINIGVENNIQNPQQHSQFLLNKFVTLSSNAKTLSQFRKNKELPLIKGGVPFMLQIPDEDDGTIEFISENLGLEVVAEYEDGYLIVATQDLELSIINKLAADFANKAHGSGNMAKILEVDENPLSENRIKRLLDEHLVKKWPFEDSEIFILDVSIESATFGLPTKPRVSPRTKPQVKLQKENEYSKKLELFHKKWEDTRLDREGEIFSFVNHYGGEVCRITDNSHIVEFPDSFSVRIKMSGKGFKDFIYNYPSLFEVSLPEDIQQPVEIAANNKEFGLDYELLAPKDNDTAVCIIDSGIQEEHRWIKAAINSKISFCFIPGKESNDVADYVPNGGHGTRVAGASIYPNEVPKDGKQEAPFWLVNARVLDENNCLLEKIFPPELLRNIVEFFEPHNIRIFNHSIAANCSCRKTRMSAWATAIDLLSYKKDVLFIQATGNLKIPDILSHIKNGLIYPHYLFEPSSRIANPAQSLQALTVGSISSEVFKDQDKFSMSPSKSPSSFTRTGFGLWESIKPEVVEFGGDDVIDKGSPPNITTPPEVCPELIRSTLNGGPPFARDEVGTSFSTPKIAHIAGSLSALFPNHETLLYRALIVNSARWPKWAESISPGDKPRIFRAMGYGIPRIDRATENSLNRVTLISERVYNIKAKEGFIFGVRIPQEMNRPGENFKVRIDVTLSYAAEPRRTRKSRRGYLGVWLDWKTSKIRETFDVFQGRALKGNDEKEGDGEGNFRWVLGNRSEKDGVTDGVSRKNGTIQKDWAIVDSYDLPDVFGIVVRGHEGWDRLNPEATARFSLVVSFEAIETEIPIYEMIRNEIKVEAESEIQITTAGNNELFTAL